MHIFIRCDGGKKLGTGHIIRQLMIAKQIKRELSITPIFIMKDILEGIERVKKENFPIKVIPKNLSLKQEAIFIIEKIISKIRKNNILCIIDILDTSKTYIDLYKKKSIKIVSFDDHSKGKFLADLRFNILEIGIEKPAKNLFEGPRYVTLDPIYQNYHNKEKKISQKASKILLTFGGSDPDNLTNKFLCALNKLNKKIFIDVVIGFAFPWKEEIIDNIHKSHHCINLYKNISAEEMAYLMFNNDMGIGTGGLTQYEFACVGLPSLIACQDVTHQYTLAQWFENKGVSKNLGFGKDLSYREIIKEVEDLLEDFPKRKKMSKEGKKICDGKGLERTIKKIKEVIR